MKRILTITICLIMATLGFAQDLDSLFNIYKDAPRKDKKAAAESVLRALIADEVVNERDTLTLQGDLDNITATLYNGMSMHHYALGNYAEALRFAEEGLPFVPADSTTMRNSYYSVVSVLAFYMKDYQKALDACEQRLTLIPEDDKTNRASVCNTLASIYKELASETLQKDTTDFKKHYYEKALHFSKEALALRREMGNDEKGLLAAFLGKQSEILTEMTRYDEALTVIEEAMTLDLEAERMNRYYQRLVQKGHIFFGEERYPEAIEVYKEALEHTDKSLNPVTYHTLLYQLGVSEQHLNDNKAAIAHLEESLDMGKEMGVSPNTNMLVALANCYRFIDPSKAYDYLVKYTAVCDSLRDAELMAQLNEFQTKYETAEKERIIEAQQQDNEHKNNQIITLLIITVLFFILMALAIYALYLRRLRARELKKMNDMKDKLISIISHDMKNSIVAQKNVLRMMCDSFDALSPEMLKNECHMLLDASSATEEQLQNMLQWVSLQMGKSAYTPIPVDLAQVAEQSIKVVSTQAEAKGVTLLNEIAKETIALADNNIISTTLRNLLTNAIKFSPSGKTIRIAVADADEKHYQIAIIDQGVGMSLAKLQEITQMNCKSTNGTNGETGTGMGLFFCKEMLKFAGSRLEFESTQGEGTTAKFSVCKR